MKNQDLFCDIHPPLDLAQARVEASRCFYCYDAPCVAACPTGIDIPSFIRKIGNGNIHGAAMDILSENIMGGTCARACPVETLCQAACVREKGEHEPVQIGKLQRFATDAVFDDERFRRRFARAEAVNQSIAVVGAGPAGLSCAHRLARLGYDVVIYEAKPKAGGLNEYGLAPYKMTDDFAQKEVGFILSIGGIRIEYDKRLGRDFTLEELKKNYATVFLGIGLGSTNELGIPGEDLPGVIDAVSQIEEIRQAKDTETLSIGKEVIVIGGGNTAVDIAIQAKELGAQSVTLVYRRGRDQMGATRYEQELAQTKGVLIRSWTKPIRIEGDLRGMQSVEFEATALRDGKLVSTGERFFLPADRLYKAIGQTLAPIHLRVGENALDISQNKIAINGNFETTVPGIYAGGDCVKRGEDLTVTAVQHGKLAALAIHRKLGAQSG